MESKKNIVFLGMMGSGKTSIGILVSKKLNLQFYDILIIGFILQILFFYSLSLLCSFLNHPKKSIFHSIMHLNGFVMNLFITNTYTKIF